jgi:hypothetical protein
MFDLVDQFEGNIYDSSYIVWVPIIQMRLRPWVKRYKEKKRLAEMENQHLEEELNNMQHTSPVRNGRGGGTGSRAGGDELIIETGGYMVSNNKNNTRRPNGSTNVDQ